ncbi:hypothetical protein C453_04424 [Haloferax elongans ATCC BAA-1513]|uniref:Uncharacterized protein n=1 Tax=Haloferax elongans ATCC BAA-1513 TaxID=1230453 RepID=M0HWS7_HALEO|nr:DUF6498-containing protein [Haloferax elongans]ELZ87569.1 hypothetical protein C453_04424 [Haloferax elongans ATCC BAA-1513]
MRWSSAPSSPLALAALVAANGLPLAGVVWFDWSLKALLVAYWLESAVVGVVNVPKILAACGSDDEDHFSVTVGGYRLNLAPPQNPRDRVHLYPTNIPAAGFFVLHYGLFWAVHGLFVWDFESFVGDIGGVPLVPVGLAAAATLVSHVGSFAVNFVGDEEYRSVAPKTQMSEPFHRVLILHLTVLFGAYLVAASGAPVAALVVMVLVKSGLDVRAHLHEHARAEKRTQQSEDGTEELSA